MAQKKGTHPAFASESWSSAAQVYGAPKSMKDAQSKISANAKTMDRATAESAERATKSKRRVSGNSSVARGHR